jgi:hypothetical protein
MAKLPTGEDASLEELKKIEPDFTFNVAIVR